MPNSNVFPKSLFIVTVILLALAAWGVCSYIQKRGMELLVDDRIAEAMEQAKQWKYGGVMPPAVPTVNWGWKK